MMKWLGRVAYNYPFSPAFAGTVLALAVFWIVTQYVAPRPYLDPIPGSEATDTVETTFEDEDAAKAEDE